MTFLSIHVVKSSMGPMVELFKEQVIAPRFRPLCADGSGESGGIFEVPTSAALWAPLAKVLSTYVRSRPGRTVILARTGGAVVVTDELSPSAIEGLLPQALAVTAMATAD